MLADAVVDVADNGLGLPLAVIGGIQCQCILREPHSDIRCVGDGSGAMVCVLANIS